MKYLQNLHKTCDSGYPQCHSEHIRYTQCKLREESLVNASLKQVQRSFGLRPQDDKKYTGLNFFVIILINFYQQFLSFDKGLLSFLAPGGACKYSPTCSEYTKQNILKYGLIKGSALGLKRLLTCR